MIGSWYKNEGKHKSIIGHSLVLLLLELLPSRKGHNVCECTFRTRNWTNVVEKYLWKHNTFLSKVIGFATKSAYFYRKKDQRVLYSYIMSKTAFETYFAQPKHQRDLWCCFLHEFHSFLTSNLDQESRSNSKCLLQNFSALSQNVLLNSWGFLRIAMKATTLSRKLQPSLNIIFVQAPLAQKVYLKHFKGCKQFSSFISTPEDLKPFQTGSLVRFFTE